MGSWRMRVALRRPAAMALLVWALAFSLLAAANALPSGPAAHLAVDDGAPVVGQAVHFDASGSRGHDAGNGAIVGYRFAFGDGAGTGWQASPLADHTYLVRENVTASVTVRDGRGLEDTAAVGIEVRSRPPAAPTPDLVPVQATLSPAAPRVGEAVSVTAVLLNDGNATALSAVIRFLDVRPDGNTTWIGNASLTDTLPPSELASVVSAPFVAAMEGNHTVRVIVTDVTPAAALGDRELHVTMVVRAPGAPPPSNGNATPFLVTPLVVGLAVAGAIALVAALILLLRPRPPGPLEPPPPAPRDRSPPPIWPP